MGEADVLKELNVKYNRPFKPPYFDEELDCEMCWKEKDHCKCEKYG